MMTLDPPLEPRSSGDAPRETSRELSLLAALFEEVRLPRGSVLTREDAVSREAYVIIDGRVTVTVGDRPMADLGPGDVVDGQARPEYGSRPPTATAVTPLHVLVVGPQTAAALRKRPAVARRLAARLGIRHERPGGPPAEA